MAINKKLIHFKNFEKFNSLKLSANEENTKYTLGINGEVQDGSPDILYQSVVWIKDIQKQWTHSQMYNCSPLLNSGDGSKFLSDDGTYKTITIPEIPSLDGYAKLEDIPTIPEIPTIEYCTNDDINNLFN